MIVLKSNPKVSNLLNEATSHIILWVPLCVSHSQGAIMSYCLAIRSFLPKDGTLLVPLQSCLNGVKFHLSLRESFSRIHKRFYGHSLWMVTNAHENLPSGCSLCFLLFVIWAAGGFKSWNEHMSMTSIRTDTYLLIDPPNHFAYLGG